MHSSLEPEETTPGECLRAVEPKKTLVWQAVQDNSKPLWERIFVQQLFVEEQALLGQPISQALKASEQSSADRLLPTEALWHVLSGTRCVQSHLERGDMSMQ